MALKDRLNDDLKAALRAGDETRKNTLRGLLAALRQAELDKRAAAARQKSKGGELSAADLAALEQTALDDAESVAALQKEAKARRESIADADRAGRADLAAGYQAELDFIDSYLPRQLSRAEVEALAQQAIAEAGATDVKQLGAVMKLLTPRTRGLADGRLVNDVVRELLSRP